ncbi:spermidine/putrescine ABC transporter substrate-binding protein [Ruegeria marisrubri]|uniref:Spermidine/putrescine ABC transporter substrate-binding protein n=1 Tax=Ruegeria marisrubri TaxID=1685379 RepID=A0A0X3TY55_9RHOB|nr:extracellular solute-binding protein [Ruegeria marisrubri]KUJ80552.1 spermidine/putrescine ABC transporter substrate-binding protein [Ruegeria marisrubri]
MSEKPVLDRRSVLKGAGAAVLASPLYSRGALASSGEINILMWSDYLPSSFIQAFESETGIKVNHTGVGSNEDIIDTMKAAKGQGFDIVSPTHMRSQQWEQLELLQPFDMDRVPVDRVNPAMVKIGTDAWNFGRNGTHWLPHIWGTEGIAYRTDLWLPAGDAPSYGDVWSEENAGKTMGRAHSMMLAAGLYMEASGEMEPGSIWAAYDDEETMRKVWGQVADWCIARKDRIKLIWNDADTQKNGLLNQGIVVGQTWDGPPLALKSAGEPVHYQAPVEGALAWVDGMAIPVGAENIDQIYAFIDFAFRAEPAGKASAEHGYNSAVLGAEDHSGDLFRKNFAEAYPGDSLANLNPWPAEPPWYAEARTEFVNRFMSA